MSAMSEIPSSWSPFSRCPSTFLMSAEGQDTHLHYSTSDPSNMLTSEPVWLRRAECDAPKENPTIGLPTYVNRCLRVAAVSSRSSTDDSVFSCPRVLPAMPAMRAAVGGAQVGLLPARNDGGSARCEDAPMDDLACVRRCGAADGESRTIALNRYTYAPAGQQASRASGHATYDGRRSPARTTLPPAELRGAPVHLPSSPHPSCFPSDVFPMAAAATVQPAACPAGSTAASRQRSHLAPRFVMPETYGWGDGFLPMKAPKARGCPLALARRHREDVWAGEGEMQASSLTLSPSTPKDAAFDTPFLTGSTSATPAAAAALTSSGCPSVISSVSEMALLRLSRTSTDVRKAASISAIEHLLQCSPTPLAAVRVLPQTP